jgi:hypothetical protein
MVHGTTDVARVEAPVTLKAYLMCAFAAFGGIFFGYDSGYINGVMGNTVFIETLTDLRREDFPEGREGFAIPSWQQSLITSILSAGTFFGAIVAGDIADWIGRRTTVIVGCGIFLVGVIMQTASAGLNLLVAGRLIAGIGVGFVSAIIILYMSEIAPKRVRGAIVAGCKAIIPIQLCNSQMAKLIKASFLRPILHHDWHNAGLLRQLWHPEPPGQWRISNSYCHPDALGHHPGHRSLFAARIPQILCQEGSP